MTFDLRAILASKQQYRASLAARPVAAKLRLLDALRERAVVLRQAGAAARRPDSLRSECEHTDANHMK